ncbi:hypothetical protein H6G69_01485 [Nostoc sp. FACHB-110]|nr:hypothetical protein [Nostoc sp. FACHB-110]
MEFQELVVVSDRFHIKPLLHLINNDGKFYVLALSQQDLKFFEGTRSSLNKVVVENLPKSLDEALLYDETAKDAQFRIATQKGSNFTILMIFVVLYTVEQVTYNTHAE